MNKETETNNSSENTENYMYTLYPMALCTGLLVLITSYLAYNNYNKNK